MKTQRLTMAQALVRYLTQQYIRLDDGSEQPLFAGVWAIFGHGNVAGLGEALHSVQQQLPTYRGHNEQSMAHAATAFAKARRRQQVMIATSSIGPGATNMVTAAALAHVNRLPLLLLPGDVFASQLPDPVLQRWKIFKMVRYRPMTAFAQSVAITTVLLAQSNYCKYCLEPYRYSSIRLNVVRLPSAYVRMYSLRPLIILLAYLRGEFGT